MGALIRNVCLLLCLLQTLESSRYYAILGCCHSSQLNLKSQEWCFSLCVGISLFAILNSIYYSMLLYLQLVPRATPTVSCPIHGRWAFLQNMQQSINFRLRTLTFFLASIMVDHFPSFEIIIRIESLVQSIAPPLFYSNCTCSACMGGNWIICTGANQCAVNNEALNISVSEQNWR